MSEHGNRMHAGSLVSAEIPLYRGPKASVRCLIFHRRGDFGYKLLGRPRFARIPISPGIRVIEEPTCGLRAEPGFQGRCKSMGHSPSCSVVTVPNTWMLLHAFPELRVVHCTNFASEHEINLIHHSVTHENENMDYRLSSWSHALRMIVPRKAVP